MTLLGEDSEATAGLLAGLNSGLLHLREQRRLGRGSKTGERLVSGSNIHLIS